MGEAKRRMLPKLAGWTPFVKGYFNPPTEADIQHHMQALGVSRDVVVAQYEATSQDEVWLNSRYQVNVRRGNAPECGPQGMVWLSIKRLDKQAVGPERFRDFQRIKNELVGPDHEAVELYPAEDRLVDTSNQYHLWVFPVPGHYVNFGFVDRGIVTTSGGGAVQQPFEE